MRLIDADRIMGTGSYIHLDRDKNAYILLDDIAKLIDAQPAAYDADKVVEQLEDLKNQVPVNRILDDITKDKPKELGQLIAYNKAIEIVKGGGVNA